MSSIPLSSASTKPQAKDDAVKIERLVGLCKLWGQVEYFHPSLVYRGDIDWDAALISTIPKVRNAETDEQYASALQSLLDVLGDPLTRVVASLSSATTQPNSDARQFSYQLTEDGVLVITVGNYLELWNQANQEKLKAVVAQVRKAKAMVFDLRSAEPVGEYGRFQLTSSFSQIERLISSVPFLTVSERSRIYRGFEDTSPFSSGQYKSGVYIQNGKLITPAQNAKDTPSIFLSVELWALHLVARALAWLAATIAQRRSISLQPR